MRVSSRGSRPWGGVPDIVHTEPSRRRAPDRRPGATLWTCRSTVSTSEPLRVCWRLCLVLASGFGQCLLSVVRGLVFGWRDVTDSGVQPAGVPPVDPGEGGQLDVFDGAPRSLHGDQLGLVEPEDRLGQGVVIGVTLGADRAGRARPGPGGRCSGWPGID